MTHNHDQGRPVSPEELPEPIRRYLGHLDPHRDHPAYAWFEMIVPGFATIILTGDTAASAVDDCRRRMYRLELIAEFSMLRLSTG